MNEAGIVTIRHCGELNPYATIGERLRNDTIIRVMLLRGDLSYGSTTITIARHRSLEYPRDGAAPLREVAVGRSLVRTLIERWDAMLKARLHCAKR